MAIDAGEINRENGAKTLELPLNKLDTTRTFGKVQGGLLYNHGSKSLRAGGGRYRLG